MVRQWHLLSPILKKQCLCFGPVFNGRHGSNRKIKNGKKHLKIFPKGGDPIIPPREISFYGSIQKEKGVPCQVQTSAHAWRELPWDYTHPRRWHVFHWAEWYSTGESIAPVEPDSSVEICPSGKSQLNSPLLLQEAGGENFSMGWTIGRIVIQGQVQSKVLGK